MPMCCRFLLRVLYFWGKHGQEEAIVPLWKCCKVFLCISSYSKTISRQIIYALFLQPVVGFWGQIPPDPNWGLIPGPSQAPNLPPWKNLAGTHGRRLIITVGPGLTQSLLFDAISSHKHIYMSSSCKWTQACWFRVCSVCACFLNQPGCRVRFFVFFSRGLPNEFGYLGQWSGC